MNALVLLTLLSFARLSRSGNERVCIIGGGISGGTSALFIRQEHSDLGLNDFRNLTVSMFEESQKIGGRMQSVRWADAHFELGASILHESNYYMKTIASHLNVTVSKPVRVNKQLGLFDGSGFLYRSASFSLLSFAKFLWRYGISDLTRLKKEIGEVADRFARFYELQRANETDAFLTHHALKGTTASRTHNASDRRAFAEVADLLTAVDLYNLTQQSAAQYLNATLGLTAQSSVLVRELIAAAVRVNYNQPLDTINALAGAVGIIPLTRPDLFAVSEGNERIPQLLVERFVDDLHLRHTVQRVVRASDGTLQLQGVHGEGDSVESFTAQCDSVVLAVSAELSGIAFDGFDSAAEETIPVRRYKHTVATFVEGRVNGSYFGQQQGDGSLPSTLLTVQPGEADGSAADTIGFTSLGGYLQDAAAGTTLYKVFSHLPLTEEQLRAMFLSVRGRDNSTADGSSNESFSSKAVSRDWRAYPLFAPPERFASFEPFPGVFYVSAFEPAVSCMECMAVAAKNTAVLLGRAMQRARVAAEEIAPPTTVTIDSAVVVVDVTENLAAGASSTVVNEL